ncbi:MAG: cytochrome c maturation protein CcmE [Ferrimicrobium sp.]|jgi:cytochrome c-type biogenesis protein CcmE|nr:cytochrome c maturation protein CcmE [Ferrimicrobium sp.]
MTLADEEYAQWKTVEGPGRSRAKLVRSLVVLGVILAALGFVLFKGATNSLEYFLTVQQANAARAKLGDTSFRMEGVVVPGSVDPTPAGVDFTIRYNHAEDRVTEIGNPPELFQPSIPVVIQGHFQGNVFVSSLIEVKHSSNYVAEHPNRIKDAGGTQS